MGEIRMGPCGVCHAEGCTGHATDVQRNHEGLEAPGRGRPYTFGAETLKVLSELPQPPEDEYTRSPDTIVTSEMRKILEQHCERTGVRPPIAVPAGVLRKSLSRLEHTAECAWHQDWHACNCGAHDAPNVPSPSTDSRNGPCPEEFPNGDIFGGTHIEDL